MTDDEIKLTFCLKVIEINRVEYKQGKGTTKKCPKREVQLANKSTKTLALKMTKARDRFPMSQQKG